MFLIGALLSVYRGSLVFLFLYFQPSGLYTSLSIPLMKWQHVPSPQKPATRQMLVTNVTQMISNM